MALLQTDAISFLFPGGTPGDFDNQCNIARNGADVLNTDAVSSGALFL